MINQTQTGFYRILLLLSTVVLSLVLTFGITNVLKWGIGSSPSKAASPSSSFAIQNVDGDSSIVSVDTVDRINLESKAPLLKTNGGPQTSVLFLQALEKITLPKTEDALSVTKEGVSKNRTSKTLLPVGFSKSAKLVRIVEGTKQNTRVSKIKNYIYSQQIGVGGKKYPVLGTIARVDVENNTDFTGFGATIVSDSKVLSGSFTRPEAEKEALARAKKSEPNEKFVLCKNNPDPKIIVNISLLGIERDTKNYLTHAVDVCNSTDPILRHTRYYVSTQKGEILFDENLVPDALNRKVFDCATGRCYPKRLEGGPVAGGEYDIAYDGLGKVYSLLSSTFSRDSFDGQGNAMQAELNHTFEFPNASWSPDSLVTMYSPGMVTYDIVGHEMTHGLTQFTAGLMLKNQSGALNESISDIFGHTIDRDDWDIGEGSAVGVIRKLNNPKDGNPPQPDSLFSNNYYCIPPPDKCDNPRTRPVESCGSLQYKFIHINSGILNFAYYLMVQGGTFNDCTMTGIGEDAAIAIIYRAQTSYLQPTSNFRDAYDAINHACSDLHGSDSNECKQVKAAMEAVEMDQQVSGTQVAPTCQGQQPQVKATCAGGGPTPDPTACYFNPITFVWERTSGDPLDVAIIDTDRDPDLWGTINDKVLETFGDAPLYWNKFIKGEFVPCPQPGGCLITTETCCGPPDNGYKIKQPGGDSSDVKLHYNDSQYKILEQCKLDFKKTTRVCTKVEGDPQANLIKNLPVACGESYAYGWILQDRFKPTTTPKATPTIDPNETPTPTPTPGGPTETPTPTPTPDLTGNPTETPTPTPEAGEDGPLNLELFAKFQGIYTKPASPRDHMQVRVGLFSQEMDRPEYKTVEFVADSNAMWRGAVSFDLPDGKYALLIKGPNHLQKKIGDKIPRETYPGTYLSKGHLLQLTTGDVSLDLTGIYQPACDIPGTNGVQDGVCNSYDIVKIRSMYSQHDSVCDLNRDGTCNSEDHALQIETLAIRFDQDVE